MESLKALVNSSYSNMRYYLKSTWAEIIESYTGCLKNLNMKKDKFFEQ